MPTFTRGLLSCVAASSLLSACGGSKLFLVDRPNDDAGRAQLVTAADALACRHRDGEDGDALMIWGCPAHPKATVLFMKNGHGWVTNCANADDEECETLTATVVAAVR